MQEALFNRLSGHYIKNNPIGRNSDFITAPEISQTFGELIAAYILQLSSNIKNNIALVEMGAGQGTLFFDILTTINKLAKNNNPLALEFLRRASFHIIEISPLLTKIQQEKLQNISQKISWHENFGELKIAAEEELIFVSNELFDCFPIDQYVKTDIGWCERLVAEKEKKLQFVTANFNPEIHNFVEKIIGIKESQNAPYGAVFEHSSAAKNFMSDLCQALQQKGGAAIIIDYGYIKNEFANSLQAIKNHKKTA
jgi:SAM-dependent MidA family methyltransferase